MLELVFGLCVHEQRLCLINRTPNLGQLSKATDLFQLDFTYIKTKPYMSVTSIAARPLV